MMWRYRRRCPFEYDSFRPDTTTDYNSITWLDEKCVSYTVYTTCPIIYTTRPSCWILTWFYPPIIAYILIGWFLKWNIVHLILFYLTILMERAIFFMSHAPLWPTILLKINNVIFWHTHHSSKIFSLLAHARNWRESYN